MQSSLRILGRKRLIRRGKYISTEKSVGKPKLPEFPEDSNYELRIAGNQKEFFVRGTPRGLILGPCTGELKAGCDDHLTVGLNADGEFVQIHRTLDGHKVWRHSTESIQLEFQKFLRSHSEDMDRRGLSEPNTYIISLNRLNIAFTVLSSLVMLGMNLVLRLVQVYDIVQLDDKKIRMVFRMEKVKAIRLMSTLTLPVVLLFDALRLLPKHIVSKMAKKAFAVFLIRPRNLERLTRDIGILLASDRLGLITMSKEGQLSFISFSALNELFRSIEKNLPFGKLSEVGYFGEGTSLELSVKGKREPVSRVSSSLRV